MLTRAEQRELDDILSQRDLITPDVGESVREELAVMAARLQGFKEGRVYGIREGRRRVEQRLRLRTAPARQRQSRMAYRSSLNILPEVRSLDARNLTVRSASEGSNLATITGQPIVYGKPYEVLDQYGSFQETMAPGAARLAITPDAADCVFLFNHQGIPLARRSRGTLTLSDTKTGLNMSATIDTRSSVAKDLLHAIERGDVSQMSAGFRVGSDTWNSDMSRRTIHSLETLQDVSAVTYPASTTTSVAVGQRNAPTANDPAIMAALKSAKTALDKAKQLQADADNNGDPDDSAVADALVKAGVALSRALTAQTKDSAPDA